MQRFPMMKNQPLVDSRRLLAALWRRQHLFSWPTNDLRPTTFSMRIAYLECFAGMSGDMFMGALVDSGIPPRILEDTVAALDIGARLEISRVMRSGISATKVDVWVDGEKDLPREEYWEKQLEHDHQHKHVQRGDEHPYDVESSRARVP